MKRKKSGLTQEAVAEKLGVSRQTISKWETDETLPDICQSKRMAQLYHVTLDEAAWGKKYPILVQYQNEVHTSDYAARLTAIQNYMVIFYFFFKWKRFTSSCRRLDWSDSSALVAALFWAKEEFD